MTATKEIDPRYARKADEGFAEAVLADNAVVVMRGDEEVEFFHNEKNAGAWIQHVYGVRPWEAQKLGIKIVPIRNRGPKPGDALVYDGQGEFYHAGFGVLERTAGSLAVCFSASAFRQGSCVSCSGGPVPWLSKKNLKLVGLKEQTFWRWHDGFAGASKGGYYTVTVPLWRWDGTTSIEDEE